MSRKVVLFIVEGESERISLELSLMELFEDSKVVFQVIRGDLTSDYKTSTASNILTTIEKRVIDYLKKKKLYVTDILEIIQIIDLDGAYLNSENILYHDKDDVLYLSDNINTRHIKQITMRNLVKSGIISKLKKLNNIKIDKEIVTYSIYYMSSNLDHVLHDDANLKDNRKISMAENFADYYSDQKELSDLIEFFKNKMFNDEHDYEESWSIIERDNISIKRGSNIYLMYKKYNEDQN